MYEALTPCQARLSVSPKREGVLGTPFYREIREAQEG